MAGQIGVKEQVLIVSSGAAATADEIAKRLQRKGIQITHRYGPRVMVGEVPSDSTQTITNTEPNVTIVDEMQPVSLSAFPDLDAAGMQGLAAFQLRQSSQYEIEKMNRPYDGIPWDAPGVQAPDPPPELRRKLAGPATSGSHGAGYPTSLRMTGEIAVGIIVVAGPTDELQFSAAEKKIILTEVQNGLAWLASQFPAAEITWRYDLHLDVQVDVEPPPASAMPRNKDDSQTDEMEDLWRNPAMAQLGYTPNWQGVVDYVQGIKRKYATEWTYVGYFTKYPLEWFAYSGGPRVVMNYANGTWGPNNIDRLFAHETGHIFQAPDEYRESDCDCGGEWGYFDKPNENCEICAPGGSVQCIMNSNSWTLCTWTPWHFGQPWPNGLNINGVDSTGVSPAAITFNGKLYVFWRANDASNQIYYSLSYDGADWPPGLTINGSDSTSGSPAVAVFNDELYVFWKENGASNHIFFSSSIDGLTWRTGQSINSVDSTSEAPTAMAFNGRLYVFWKANDNSDRIFFSASISGLNWPPGKSIDGSHATASSVAAAVFNEKLYLVWAGANKKSPSGPRRIYLSCSDDGQRWADGKAINDIDMISDDAPAALSFDGKLYVFWKAADSSDLGYVSVSEDGENWPSGKKVNLVNQFASSPSAAEFGGNPYLFWKGENSKIYFSA